MIPTMRNGLQVGLCIGKKDNYFSEKGIDFRPATLVNICSYFYSSKLDNFQMKSNNFLIFAQNIDCGYTLEPSHRTIEAVLTRIHNQCLEQK